MASLIESFMASSEAVDETVDTKHDHELNVSERMFLMNKHLDEQILYESLNSLMNVNRHSRIHHLTNAQKVQLNDYVFQDIELLSDHYGNESKSIFSVLDQCETQSGRVILKELILHPICDVSILEERQKMIQMIGKHAPQIRGFIHSMKSIEKEMLWFYNEKNMHHIDMMNDFLYFNYDFIPIVDVNGILNGNEKALLITNIYKIFIAPALTVITPLISLILPIILFFWFQRKTGIKLNTSMIYQLFMKIIFGADSFKLLFKNPTKAVIANLCTKALYVFLYFQNIYYSIQNARNTNKIIDTIHVRLNYMKSYIQKMYQLIEYSKKHHLDQHFDATIMISLEKCDKWIQTYYQLFDHSIFESEPSLFNHKGRILYTYRHFNQIKHDFIHLFHFVGMFDAYHSLSKIIASSSPTNPYSFTEFMSVDMDKDNKSVVPHISFESIWHPYLIKDTKLNSLNIGKNHILITGPNAAGKSTFIKAVIVNILMSQTLGISSASRFVMTPFKMIETYLQIPDAKGVASLFEAEMIRSKLYIDKLKKMREDHFSFIVLDEIFSSTNYMEGFSGAYAILKKIASFPNTISMTTTHYSDLEHLEKHTTNIKNYHFEIDRNPETEEIIFNYQLKSGVSRTYIALELLRNNGFDEDLIQDALAIRKQIHVELKREEVKVEEVEVKNEEVKTEEIKTEEVKNEEVKTEEIKTEEVKNEEVKTEEVKVEEVKTEEIKTEEVKVEEVKTEEVKVEEEEKTRGKGKRRSKK